MFATSLQSRLPFTGAVSTIEHVISEIQVWNMIQKITILPQNFYDTLFSDTPTTSRKSFGKIAFLTFLLFCNPKILVIRTQEKKKRILFSFFIENLQKIVNATIQLMCNKFATTLPLLN